ncbi:MAG TPA: hypothetical protein VKB77_07565 [Terriglobales bacterium]|nr:hypothetical protein [Terriglobales bacterium]
MSKCAPAAVILASFASGAFSQKRSEQKRRKAFEDMEQMVRGVVLDESF